MMTMKLKTGTSFELYMTDFVNLAVIHQTTGLSPPEALKKEKPEVEKEYDENAPDTDYPAVSGSIYFWGNKEQIQS